MKYRSRGRWLCSIIVFFVIVILLVMVISMRHIHKTRSILRTTDPHHQRHINVRAAYNETIPLTLWSSDFHISPIADIKSILKDFRVSVIDKSLSGHCHLSGTCERNLKVINKQNGISLSPCANTLRREFYEAYKNDPEFNSVDAFICTHATGMCELFMAFNKPMILIASTRYEIGRHDVASWSRWNNNLARIAADPRNLIAANNRYDQEYMKYFTGLSEVELMPNLCSYVETKYKPTRTEILVAPSRGISNVIMRQLKQSLQAYNANISTNGPFDTMAKSQKYQLEMFPIRELYPHFEYSDLAAHPAFVILPYQVSFMSLFEFYRMEIPLFIPSPSLLADWHMSHRVLNERTWASVFGMPQEKSMMPRHSNYSNTMKSDPNNEFSREAVLEWIKLADFYQWPHIQQFDTWEELYTMLYSTADFPAISRAMHTHNVAEAVEVRERWKRNLLRIQQAKVEREALVYHPPHETVDEALKELYGYTLSTEDCATELPVESALT